MAFNTHSVVSDFHKRASKYKLNETKLRNNGKKYTRKVFGSITHYVYFFSEQVCAWVGKNGGWEIVLRSGFNMLQQTFILGACAVVMICGFIYIRKSISSNAGQ